MAQSDIGEPRNIEAMSAHYLPGKDNKPTLLEPLDHLISTTITIYNVYVAMEDISVAIITPYQKELLPHALEKYGLFSEAIQVKASISMGMISTNGLCFDVGRARKMVEELTHKVNELTAKIRKNEEWKVWGHY